MDQEREREKQKIKKDRERERERQRVFEDLRPQVVPFYRFFFGGGFPYEDRLQRKGYPYSNLSTGGPTYSQRSG